VATPQEEDRAMSLARQLNEAGIHADPGVLGGVVIYATADQAELYLAGLVPAAAQAEHNQVVAAANRRHAEYIGTEVHRWLEELARLDGVLQQRTGQPELPQDQET
jgi:hypothetical protein